MMMGLIGWLPFPVNQYNLCVKSCECLCSGRSRCVRRFGKACYPKWPITLPTRRPTMRPTIPTWSIWSRWADDNTLNPVRNIQGYNDDDAADLSEKAVNVKEDMRRSCYLCCCD